MLQKLHFLKGKVEKENFDEKRSGFLGRGGGGGKPFVTSYFREV
jgi:hypothetical protein